MKAEMVLAISLVVNIFFASLFGYFVWQRGGVRYIQHKISRQRPINYTYETRVSIFRHLGTSKDDIYFIGQSTTSFAEWSELIGPHVKNRSISGETTAGILTRIDTITNGSPRKVLLMIGINDLLRGVPIYSIINNYESIISELSICLPMADIYLASVLPIHNIKFNQYIMSQRTDEIPRNEDVEILNNALKSLALKHPRARYIDLSSLTHNGELRDDCTIDGIHLDGNGLTKLAEILRQYTDE